MATLPDGSSGDQDQFGRAAITGLHCLQCFQKPNEFDKDIFREVGVRVKIRWAKHGKDSRGQRTKAEGYQCYGCDTVRLKNFGGLKPLELRKLQDECEARIHHGLRSIVVQQKKHLTDKQYKHISSAKCKCTHFHLKLN